MGVVPGWPDREVFVLLELFRAHLWDYIYRSGEEFAKIVHAALPEKSEKDVVGAVRLVMKQFALAFDTHNFRGQRLIVDGNEVFVNEYLHETIKLLRENRSGGVYLPDELVRFLRKAKMYKQYLHKKPQVFFSRIQLWGKSVAESQAKFYALRDMYHIEKQDGARDEVDAVNAIRLQELGELFDDVSRAPAKTHVPASTSKLTSKLWSPDDLEVLVDLLVTITRDMQQKGTSALIQTVASKLRRTEGSCVNKLQDIRERFLKRSTAFRAANLPDVIYDITSDANKIFNADWTDPHDPYAIGFLAMKSHFYRATKRKKPAAVPSGRTTRAMVRGAPSGASRSQQPNRRGDNHSIQDQGTSARRRERSVAEEVAAAYGWSAERTSAILASMKRNLPLYRAEKQLPFFLAISNSMGDPDILKVMMYGSRILRLFETRGYGGLDALENMSFGAESDVSATAAPISAGVDKENDPQLLPGTTRGPTLGSMSMQDHCPQNLEASACPMAPAHDAMHDYACDYRQGEASTASGKLHEKCLTFVDRSDEARFAQGLEIGWTDDSPDRLSAGEEDAFEDQSLDSPDSPEHTSSTSSFISDSKDNRHSDGSSLKRFRSPSHGSTSLCISCHKKLKASVTSGNPVTPDSSFGKQMPTIANSTGLVGAYADEDDEDDEAECVDESNDDLESNDSDIGTSDDEEDPVRTRVIAKLKVLIRADEDRIKELEAKNLELIERKAERERLEAEAQAARNLCNEVPAQVAVSRLV